MQGLQQTLMVKEQKFICLLKKSGDQNDPRFER